MHRPTALLVEDDRNALRPLAQMVRKEGFTARCASSLAEARDQIHARRPAVALIDIRLPDGLGLDLVQDLRRCQDAEILLMTGEPTVDAAVEAMHNERVRDYLTKPLDLTRLRAHLVSIKTALDPAKNVDRSSRGTEIDGASPPMRRLRRQIERVAPTEAPVLIIGESGTGKELVARSIHERSERAHRPLVIMNCGAIPESLIESELFGHEKGAFTGAEKSRRGFFEQADTGTLFLDEVTEMPLDLQVRLLRVLETGKVRRVGGEREIDTRVRVVAATNRVPEEAVREGKLREDMLFRLSVFPIHVPALRQRGRDVDLLADRFITELNEAAGTQKTFADGVYQWLRRYAWPGNVRQLRNFVHHAFIMSDGCIDLDEFPQSLTSGVMSSPGASVTLLLGISLAEAEKHLLLATLEHVDGDKRRAAELLGISLKTVYNRLKTYNEDASESS